MLYMLGAIGLAAWGPVAQGIEQQPSKLKVAGSNPAGVANNFKGLRPLRFGHSDKRAAAHSDNSSAVCSRVARRFFAPASTCFMVRLA